MATLESNEAVSNAIGRPEHAVLVLRCRDGELAAYVGWVGVLKPSTSSQTMVLQRLDNGPIKPVFWDRSLAGTAAGAFDTRKTTKLLALLEPAGRLAVRMTSYLGSQDASFDLDGISAVAARIRSTCGLSGPPAPKERAAGPTASSAVSEPQDASLGPGLAAGRIDGSLAAVRARLEAQGFQVAEYSEGRGALVTRPKEQKLSTAQADCGKSFGIPYLADRRSRTWLTVTISTVRSELELRLAVSGEYLVAPASKVLNCSPTEAFQREMIEALSSSR